MHVQAHYIKTTAGIHPVGWSNHTFIAESKNLAANNKVCPAFRGTAELNIGLADIPGILIRQCIGHVLIEKDMRVLGLPDERDPFRPLNPTVEPDPAYQI